MKDDRRKQIEAMVARRDTVTMEELRREFGVSMNTVRSDVAYLVDTGAVEKIYGGVRSVQRQEVPLFTQRTQLRADEKRRIARYAQDLIEDGDTLYIDAGTTTMHLVDFLDPGKHVTIVTGNLYVAHQAYDKPNAELIVLPGGMNRRTNSVSDVSTLEFLGRYQFAKAFMGASGVSLDGKLNVSTYIEYELKKLAVARSRQVFLLLDGGKFGGSSLMSYGSLEDMTEIITAAPCPEEIRDLCQRKGVRLTIMD
ncbi:MAG: DeoR/GlpR transcriptional regulator [Oscillibacter sp.]|nr:DeoR/GlpR transcriptional regulator [Oscillibacter sp.]